MSVISSKSNETGDTAMELAQKLLVSGVLRLKVGDAPILLQRGMPVLTEDGQEACRVAAVVVDSRSQEVTHLLLGPVPPTYDYRLIPLNLVSQVQGGEYMLRLRRLPCWQFTSPMNELNRCR